MNSTPYLSRRIASAAVAALVLATALPDTAHAVRGSGGLTFPSDGPAGGFGLCKKKYISATGKALSKDRAKKRARRNWQTKATFRYGAPLRHWNAANDRQYGCDKKGRWWHCTAFAYPCM